jgi:hypothetical protein
MYMYFKLLVTKNTEKGRCSQIRGARVELEAAKATVCEYKGPRTKTRGSGVTV